MKIKMFEFNRYKESYEAFEARVRGFVTENSNVIEMRSWENLSNSNMVMQLSLGEERLPQQDLSVFAGLDLDTLEELANNTLESVARTGAQVKQLNIVSTSKAPAKHVLIVLVQQSESDLHGKAQQDSRPNDVADSSPERSERSGNRKTSKGRP